ncbi:MAG: type II toxin-antitoxin system VapC family toxin [Chloroflexota bacterium]|nr:type II toxin-antitoxin system VapC family toxin [Chloroflexota bacterium]MDE2682557.1 type II toxin-antitoxin system VapC family toxin [Chloroflexota bacterium]
MILPDTHTLLWYMALNPRLGTQAEHRILRSRILGEVAFSAISVWEVALLLAKGRLTLNVSAIQWRQNLLGAGFIEIPVDGAIAARSVALPDFHDDPADRIIVATALDGHQLITDDRDILNWPGLLNRFPAGR